MIRRSRRRLIAWLSAVIVIAGGHWLWVHPWHNPFSPLQLAHPTGWATRTKLITMGGDAAACTQALDRANYRYRVLVPVGSGACLADQRTVIDAGQRHIIPLQPAGAAPSCAVSITLLLWTRDVVQPMALQHLGQRVISMDHLGSYNCRRIAGRGDYSEHATGNAIDIAAFTLEDGNRINLLDHWAARDARSAFLHGVRDRSCALFSTVLSPDHNRAHANHFHLDQAQRTMNWSVCR